MQTANESVRRTKEAAENTTYVLFVIVIISVLFFGAGIWR